MKDGRKVLVVEDMDVNRMVAIDMLANPGVETDPAEDGETALRMIAGHDYALVFMDSTCPTWTAMS